jgi:hypothetical protein
MALWDCLYRQGRASVPVKARNRDQELLASLARCDPDFITLKINLRPGESCKIAEAPV